MFGRRSRSFDSLSFHPDPERLLRKSQSRRVEMENPNPNPNPAATPLRDHYIPNNYTPRIPHHNVLANHYEIKPGLIQMLPNFYGNTNEDPYRHLDDFLEICSTVRIPNYSEDALKMTLFQFSLKDKAKHWFRTLEIPPTTWELLQREFLKKYFPIGKTNQIRRSLTNFSQAEREQFHETWERLKDLMRQCPHHHVPRWQLVQSFYDGLTPDFKKMVDASCGGTFMTKSEEEAWSLFETLSENSVHHLSATRSDRVNSRKEGIYHVNTQTDLEKQVATLTKQMSQFLTSQHKSAQVSQVCDFCSDPNHPSQECPIISGNEVDQVHSAHAFSKLGNNPYSNTYNPGWRNHPNFSWRNQTNPNGFDSQPRPNNFNKPNPNYTSGPSQPINPQVQDLQSNFNRLWKILIPNSKDFYLRFQPINKSSTLILNPSLGLKHKLDNWLKRSINGSWELYRGSLSKILKEKNLCSPHLQDIHQCPIILPHHHTMSKPKP